MNEKLKLAFSSLQKPTQDQCFLSDTEEWDTAKNAIYKKNWDELCMSDFETSFGLMELISVFSEMGFQYYLPGLIKISEEDPDSYWLVVNSLFNIFTISDIDINYHQKLLKYIDVLTPEQNLYLRIFFLKSITMDDCISPLIVHSAISNLENHNISPYSQNELEKWSRSHTP